MQDQDIFDKAEKYRVRTHRRTRGHQLAANQGQRMHIIYGVPVVIATTIVGTAIFAALSKQVDIRWQIITGLISLLAAVLSALQTFFGFAEVAQKHRLSSANYAALYRSFDIFMLRKGENVGANRQQVITELDELLKQYSQFERESLSIPDKFYDQAVKEQENDKDGI